MAKSKSANVNEPTKVDLFVIPTHVVAGNKFQLLLQGDGIRGKAQRLKYVVKQVAPDPVYIGKLDPQEVDIPGQQVDPDELRVQFSSSDLPPGVYQLDTLEGETQIEETRFTIVGSVADQVAANGSLEVSLQRVTRTDDQPLWIQLRNGTGLRSFSRYETFIKLALAGSTGAEPTPSELSMQAFNELQNRKDYQKRLHSIAPETSHQLAQEDACYYRYGTRGFEILKAATEIFLLCEACDGFSSDCFPTEGESEAGRLGVPFDRDRLLRALERYLNSSAGPGTLPYVGQILQNLSLARQEHLEMFFPFWQITQVEDPDDRARKINRFLETARTRLCLLELIWSYWHEEGMLVQSINAVAMRFQNRRVRSSGPDPLANFALDPLRPLNNLLWGYIQDQQHHLSLPRRAHEYAHEYGLTLQGKAVGQLSPVESRSRFLEAFHDLLHAASVYYREITNKFVQPDAFPILDKLRTVHLILAEGAVNQFGDLPTTARQEMLIQQWLLAQQPMRDFLQSRATIPYDEPWMGQVDAMKRMMGWHEASVTHFQRLAVNGELLLLSMRLGNWSKEKTGENAENWLRYWKPEVQNYIEAYRAVTRVDLSAIQQPTGRVDATMPSLLLQRQLRPAVAARS